LSEGLAGAVEVGLDVAGVAEVVAEEVKSWRKPSRRASKSTADFEGEEGDFGGESVGDGVEAGIGFAEGGRGPVGGRWGAGGFFRVALVGGALRFGDGSGHGFRVTWGG